MCADRLSEHVSQKTYKGCIFAPVSHWKGGSDVSLPYFLFPNESGCHGHSLFAFEKAGSFDIVRLPAHPKDE